MSDESTKDCACGCGETLPESSTWAFKRGHKGSSKKSTGGANRKASPPDEEAEVEAESIDVSMNEAQLNRIWSTLSLYDKAVAIATALNTEPQE